MEYSEHSLCKDCPVKDCMSQAKYFEVVSCGKKAEFESKGK